ncbi:MAG TPA: hypothetical protein PKI01_12855 [Bacteroidales bacterium]|nr:hypothetical protein [Bacteroidales bacterium]
MKKIIVCIIALLIVQELAAQSTPLLNRWSHRTAYLMRKNKYESGLVQPFRYGISNRVEISTNVLQNFVVPNAGVKVFIADVKGFHMASEHGFQYNSLLFKLLSRKGTGGILSPQFTFPNMFTLSSAFLVTKQVFDTAYVTARAGFFLGMHDGELDPLATVDFPVIYPRTSHLFNTCTFRLGADIRGKIKRSWSYMFDLQFYVLPVKEHNFFMENTGTIMCNLGKNARFKGGYKLCYGDYPFGKQWHLLPTIDIVFGSK